ncbi:MAG: enoyl-CoA hydratase/isomerase family protein [Chloroflexi bacterium]|nr:enoyl-CoA hydratase/isomerase family protein [Chloroflexota bacterium]
MPVLLYEKRDGVAYITLNRPEALNAFNDELNEAIGKVWTDFRDDKSLFVGILTGSGRAFSTGADLKEMTARGMGAGSRPLNTPIKMEVWKPLIAAIDGYAVGGGFGMALQCDIRLATERSELGDVETRVSSWGALHLTRMIPVGEALYILLSGARIKAQEAYRIGLVHKVLPDRESLMQEAKRIADELKLAAPLAVQAVRRLTYTGLFKPWEEVDALAQKIRHEVSLTEDAQEGPRAFAEKRKPVWKMR